MAANGSRRRRGADTERTVADAWRGDGWPHAEVVRGPGADLTGTPGIAVEIKARRELSLLAWMKQTASRPGVPVLIIRPDGAGPATVDDWPAILPHRVLRELLHHAGYGTATNDQNGHPA